ncbi:MAG: alpha/beta fold hydrolase [Moraxellaceae bacterium]|nr:alpha/beta fold hydrolase [Moraxellaceae bacterium]HQV41332.1 alpha/beta fold hydrolase [Moraxellaceae bacterium]HQX89334.1 alpha/beta fold hydrolase [Moraxellaceae bacterium]
MSKFIDRSVRFYRTGSAFVNNAIQRRVNKAKYIQADKSNYEVICTDGLMSVRHYKAQPPGSTMMIDGKPYVARQRRYAMPIVLVPPLGVFGWIFDLMADRSMVQYFLAHGFDVYLIDWGAPSADDKNLSLEDYVCRWFPKAMAAIREHSGSEEQSLVGYCMGGLLALMYLASSKDDNVANLVTIASPVDMHQMGFSGPLSKALSKPIWAIGKITGLKITEMENRFFHVPGNRLSLMFKMTNPLGTVSSYLQLVRNMADDDYVSRYMTMSEWFTNMPDYPGATVQEMIRKMGLYNRMTKGRFRIGNRVADFNTIHANLLAFAGDSDNLVPIPAAEAIMNVVASTDKTFEIVPGGHAGVFTGSKATHTTWSITKDWLSQRSGRISSGQASD